MQQEVWREAVDPSAVGALEELAWREGRIPARDGAWGEQLREPAVTCDAVVLAGAMSEPCCGVGGVGHRQQKSWQRDQEALVSLRTR